ncbi:hypothetical protein ACE6H2_009807 [Prunus campanulata]
MCLFVSHLTIIAPEVSPNTDGIDISSSHNVFIQHTSIGTGDDCIAINGDCSDHQRLVWARPWYKGGSRYARNITFEKITLDASKNPIIIDQFYCDRDHDCKSQASAVSVDYVKYIDFEGTSASKEAIKLDCD